MQQDSWGNHKWCLWCPSLQPTVCHKWACVIPVQTAAGALLPPPPHQAPYPREGKAPSCSEGASETGTEFGPEGDTIMALRGSKGRLGVNANSTPARCNPHLHVQAPRKSWQELGTSLHLRSWHIFRNLGLQPPPLTSTKAMYLLGTYTRVPAGL